MSDELFLFCDTETTGFPKNGPKIQEGQARVCQIALLLTDAAGKSLCEFSSLVKPDGRKVGEGAQKVHGFSTEDCDKYGLSSVFIFKLYAQLAKKSQIIVAHNSSFDENMMGIEDAYYMGSAVPDEFHNRMAPVVNNPWHCTMKSCTNILKIPGLYGEYKWPKLEEALEYFTGRKLGSYAHDAMYDVKACRDIFFSMRALKDAV